MPEQFLAPDPPAEQEQFLPPDSPSQPAPQPQVAAGQGAITPQQVPAGAGAIGPSAVIGGVTDWAHRELVKLGLRETPGPTAGWRQAPGEPDPLDWLATTAKKAWDLPEQLAPEAEEHLKNFMATVAGIKRQPAQTPAQAPTQAPAPAPSTAEGTNVWQAFPSDQDVANQLMKLEGGVDPTDPPGIRERNNNPGNLKAPGGGFQKFGSWEEGKQALIQQVKSWRAKFPDWTIADLNRRYAPDTTHGGDNPPGTEAGRNQQMMRAINSAQPAPTAEADPPPGFVIEPKSEDFDPANLPEMRAAVAADKALARIQDAIGEPYVKASMPYIALQMYKKATGQPNDLKKIPSYAVNMMAPLLVGGLVGEEAEPVLSKTEKAGDISTATQAAVRPDTEETEATGELVTGKLPERFKPIQMGERTAIRAERTGGPMRLVQRDGKWYDAQTGAEYKWNVRRRM